MEDRKEIKVGKFQSNLVKSNKEIKTSRAERISRNASNAYSDIIRTLEKRFDSLEDRKEDLLDLSPDSELSLNPIKGDFDAATWCSELQKIEIDILNVTVELKVARQVSSELFGE